MKAIFVHIFYSQNEYIDVRYQTRRRGRQNNERYVTLRLDGQTVV